MNDLHELAAAATNPTSLPSKSKPDWDTPWQWMRRGFFLAIGQLALMLAVALVWTMLAVIGIVHLAAQQQPTLPWMPH